MSQDHQRGARPLQALADVRAALAVTCNLALSRVTSPAAHQVVERHRGPELKIDIPSRDFCPLDRPFLALDAFATCKVAAILAELRFPAGGPDSYGILTAKVMGPIRIMLEELKSNMFQLLRHLLTVDMQTKLGAQSDQIREAIYELRTLLASDPD